MRHSLRKSVLVLFAILVVVIIVSSLIYFNTRAHRSTKTIPLPSAVRDKPQIIKIRSPVITNGSNIPKRYTCDGLAISPPITIYNIPREVKELVLIMYDPDAPNGIFYHWVMYQIKPSEYVNIPEALPATPIISGIGVQGVNSYGKIGYGPPCPPRGSKHRYVILVIGLNRELRLPPGLTAEKLLAIIKPHVVAYGLLYGYYSR